MENAGSSYSRNSEPTRDDHIDKSCWLPVGEPIITPERRHKGDMTIDIECADCDSTGNVQGVHCRACRGKGRVPQRIEDAATQEIRYAQSHVRNILNYLWNNGDLTDQQAHDGKTYEIWKSLSDANFGLRKKATAEGDGGTGVSEYGFVLLIRALGLRDCKIVESAIFTVATEHSRFVAARNKHQYQAAFERLSAIILQVREQIAAISGQELCDEYLAIKFKKLLASLKT